MRSLELDCRGLSCPLPVLETKKALERLEHGTLRVLVDNEAARDNVRRFALHAGCRVEVAAGEGVYYLTITRGPTGEAPEGPPTGGPGEAAPGGEVRPAPCAPLPHEAGTVYLVTSATLGQGAADLGETLMKNFLETLARRDGAPAAVIFLNTGVHLALEGSPVAEALRRLENGGARVLSCGTCLEYYGVKGRLAVGRVTNMYEIGELLAGPYRVVTLG
ncbi:MAG: sulfurtransferase-like selenium metabolism protein YedF [Firmicutes bacterium]|nr:sulfurtransferase-like selenium metabolism protein YedF [Bacillota bacterium]